MYLYIRMYVTHVDQTYMTYNEHISIKTKDSGLKIRYLEFN